MAERIPSDGDDKPTEASQPGQTEDSPASDQPENELGNLVLVRKIGQVINIGGSIYVTVLGVERNRVKIGVAAPREIIVFRQELLDREQSKAKGEPVEDNGLPPDNNLQTNPQSLSFS